jgi:Bacterial regulatory proteins, tetR family
MDAIASTARVGKATIYRRRGSKEDLLVSLIYDASTDLLEGPDTGSLREDLQLFLTSLVGVLSSPGGGPVEPCWESWPASPRWRRHTNAVRWLDGVRRTSRCSNGRPPAARCTLAQEPRSPQRLGQASSCSGGCSPRSPSIEQWSSKSWTRSCCPFWHAATVSHEPAAKMCMGIDDGTHEPLIWIAGRYGLRRNPGNATEESRGAGSHPVQPDSAGEGPFRRFETTPEGPSKGVSRCAHPSCRSQLQVTQFRT